MKKNFVLDTNVLLHDPRSIFSFDDNNVVIPIYVIEEIDNFKRDLSSLGRNARAVARSLDDFRAQGRLKEGVPIGAGKGTVRVLFTDRQLPPELRNGHSTTDDRILAVALDISQRERELPAVFVSKDTNLRIRADAMGLTTEDYDVEGVDLDELWSGVAEVEVEAEAVNQFYAQGVVPLAPGGPRRRPTSSWCCATGTTRSTARWASSARPGRPTSRSSSSPRRGSGASGRATRSSPSRSTCCSTTRSSWSPSWARRAPARRCSPSPPACRRPWRRRPTRSCSSRRPIFPLGRDIGYLPGDVEEKLNPWMQPIFDNVEFLMNLSRSDKKLGRGYHELIDLGILEIEPLTYIRGRSIPNQFMIVDEAQNLTPHEVKTIITRVGDGTKIVLTGDPYQIDNPYVDSTNNGLVHVVNRFKQEKLAAHVTLSKGERSPLAELAANLL